MPDKTTLRIALSGPDVAALKKLAPDNLAMLAREMVEQNPKLSTAEAVVGTGAFMMKSIEANVGGDYVRNPDYWKPGLPHLDGFRTRAFPEYLTAWADFQAGQVDVCIAPGSEVQKHIAQQGHGYSPDWYNDDTVAFRYPNMKVKPMDDQRVLGALRLLVDHDEFIKAWAEVQYGRGAYGSILPTALSAWDLTGKEYRDQLECKQPKDAAAKEALSLLSAAGFGKDNPLKFTLLSYNNPDYAAGAQLLRAPWKRLSQGAVDAQLKLADIPTASGIKVRGEFAYAYLGISNGTVDPDPWLSLAYHTDGSQNLMGFGDCTLDAMIDKQRGILDETRRKAAIKEIILYTIDHLPCVIPGNRYFLNGVRPRVHGHVPEYKLNGRLHQSVWVSA